MNNQGFNEAVHIIVDSALNQKQFDITLTCEIVSTPDENSAEKNYYVVESDKLRFGVYSKDDDTTKYRIGDIVSVLIPKGDYSDKKMITGRQTSFEEIPEYVDMLNPEQKFAPVWSVDSLSLDTEYEGPGRRINIFPDKSLHVKLSAYVGAVKGTLPFYIVCSITSIFDTGKEGVTNLIWYSQDMTGKIDCDIPFIQEVVLTKNELKQIQQIKNIKFFVQPAVGTAKENIFVSDISFSIGYERADLSDGLYILTTNGKTTYTKNKSDNLPIEIIFVKNQMIKNGSITVELVGSEFLVNDEKWQQIKTADDDEKISVNKTRLNINATSGEVFIPEMYYYMHRGVIVERDENATDTTSITSNGVIYDIANDLINIDNKGTYLYIAEGGIYTENDGYVNNQTTPQPRFKTYWYRFNSISDIVLHRDKKNTVIKAVVGSLDKTVFSEVTTEFKNTDWKFEDENPIAPQGYLVLSSEKTFYPIYDNYGSLSTQPNLVIKAKRRDDLPFAVPAAGTSNNERYITWKFYLPGNIAFPYKPGTDNWIPVDGALWYHATEKNTLTEVDSSNFETTIGTGTGYGYVTIPISEPAAAQQITCNFKNEFNANTTSTVSAVVHYELQPPIDIIQDSIDFTLGFGDTHGTGYAFNIIPKADNHYFYVGDGSSAKKEYEAILYSENGEKIDLKDIGKNLTWSWLYQDIHSHLDNGKQLYKHFDINTEGEEGKDYISIYYRIYLEEQKENGLYIYDTETQEYKLASQWENGKDYYTLRKTKIGNICTVQGFNDKGTGSIYYPNFHILVAELRNFGLPNGQTITLKAYLPIIQYAIGTDTSINVPGAYSDIKGTTYMIYDTLGNRVTSNDESEPYMFKKSYPMTVTVSGYGTGSDDVNTLFQVSKDKTYLKQPALDPSSGGRSYSLTLSLSTGAWLKMPLMITTNTWFSERINDWDGGMLIDEEGNYILTSMVGAGKKNSSNQFTGVLMGEVGKDLRSARSGLYGFKDGENTFRLSAEDGNFRFGTNNQNIEFDGEKLLLKDVMLQFTDGEETKQDFLATRIKNAADTAYTDALSDAQTYVDTNYDDIEDTARKYYNKTQIGTIEAGKTLVDAYEDYTNSKVGNLDKAVADYLKAGEKTLIGEDYVISPYIGGGYLNITNGKKQVIIDPSGKTNTDYIFQVHNNKEISVAIKPDGDAIFKGQIHALAGGSIAGWNMTDTMLYKKTGDYAVALSSGSIGTDSRIFAFGKFNPADPYWGQEVYFSVTGKGKLVATGADISGELKAGSGSSLGGFTVEEDGFGMIKTANNKTTGIWFESNPSGSDCFINCIGSAGSFYVTADGVAHTTGADISGKITATGGGQIGGFTITNGKYLKASGVGMGTSGNSWAFWAGTDDPLSTSNPFYITHGGELHATKAHITGNITCRSLTIETGANVTGLTITGSMIAQGTITADKLNVGSITAGAINIPSDYYNDVALQVDKGSKTAVFGSGATGTGAGSYQAGATIPIEPYQNFSIGNSYGRLFSGHDGAGYIAIEFARASDTGTTSRRLHVSQGTSSINGPWVYNNGQNNYDSTTHPKIIATRGWVESRPEIACLYVADKTFSWSNGSATRTYISSQKGYGMVIGSDNISGDLVGTWWCNSNNLSTSDLRVKNNIKSLSLEYQQLYDNLNPVSYKYNDGTSGRTHIGFIAQDIVSALEKTNLTTQDFAAVCQRDHTIKDSEWGVRYEEFIALNTWQIQKAKTRISELENKIAQLEQLIINGEKGEQTNE